MERQDVVSLRDHPVGAEPTEPAEVLDVTLFQRSLARIRERNQQLLEQTPAEWARRVTDIQEAIRTQRTQLEDALLDEMLMEEAAMLDRLEDVERNLRNMIRLYRQLMDERNAMVSGLLTLHRWIREVELKRKRKPHRDHGVDLTQKSFVEYLSKQAWFFDNSGGWDLEEPRRRGSASGG